MPQIIKNTLLLLTALSALAGGYWLAQILRAPTLAPVTPTQDPINFSLPDLNGRARNLSEWHGKIIVLNFWATWCPPCKKEIPAFINLQRKYGVRGLQVLGVAMDGKNEVSAYAAKRGINYPLLLGPDHSLQLMARYGNPSGSLPFSVLIDRRGKIVSRKLGAYTQTELEALISPLIPGPGKRNHLDNR